MCIGAIEIEATPPGVVTIGGVESIVLTCTLQSIEPNNGIVYMWTRGENSLPSGAQISGSELLFNIIAFCVNTIIATMMPTI